MIKFRVDFVESERGWGSEYYSCYYETESEARDIVKETNDKYCSTSYVPDFYICATYFGEVEGSLDSNGNFREFK